MNDIFFSLLRLAIGTGDVAPSLTFSEIKQIYEISRKQALTGVMFYALKKGGVRPSDESVNHDEYEDLVMGWMGDTVKIARTNKKQNRYVAEVAQWFDSHGFECCLLKGQGNALYYPETDIRIAGDIDLWVRTKERKSLEENVKTAIRFVRNNSKDIKAVYHHVDGLSFCGTAVEVHYRPHFMQNFLHNARLQQYFLKNEDRQFAHGVEIGGRKVAVPTTEFNLVFQLSHIYQHLFNEGIGLRQILDYFYLIQNCESIRAEEGKTIFAETFKSLGLKNIAGALMWVLIESLGMDRELALVEPDERRGKFLLTEILAAGNFGRQDERYHFGTGKIGHNIQRLFRDVRMVRFFPGEALCEPLFRLYNAWWRIRHR